MRRELPFLALLLLLTGLVYLPGLPGGPVYDDAAWASLPQRLSGPGALLRAFRDPLPSAPVGAGVPTYAWRPLTELSVLLQVRCGLGSPAALRAGNLLIHALSVLLVFWIARQLGERQGPAFPRWAAALFALHPLGVQAVTYLYQRATSLQALLVFLCLGLYLKARVGKVGQGGGWPHWAAFAAGALAMGAKESAVTLVLVLAAVEWVLRDPAEGWGRRVGRLLPFALLPGIVAIQALRFRFAEEVPAGMGSYAFRPLDHWLVEARVLVRYLFLDAWPFPLRFLYDRVVPAPGAPVEVPWLRTALCVGILLGLGAWVLFGRSRKLLRLGLALVFAPLAVEAAVPIVDIAFNHRCYPGLLGVALLFAAALARLKRPLLGGAALLGLALLTARENALWTDAQALARRDVRHAFHLDVAWTFYGQERLARGDGRGANRLFLRGMQSPWKNPRTFLGRARALRRLGQAEAAGITLDFGLSTFPGHPLLLAEAVDLACEIHDEARLGRLALQAISATSLSPDLACWVALREIQAGRPAEGRRVLEGPLRRLPGYAPLWMALGRTFAAEGRTEEAETAYARARGR